MPYLTQHQSSENFMESLLRDAERYGPIVQALDNIVLNLSELTWAEAEWLGRELGLQNGSDFCAGIRGGMIQALDGENPTDLRREKLRPLLTFARKLNADSAAITQQDVNAVTAVGWSDQTVEDVIALAAVLKVYSIMANGFGFKGLPTEAFDQIGAATVSMKGYMPVFNSFVEKMKGAA